MRAEGEFAQGAIPGFRNAPILTDHERHQVGLTYKQRGQDAAIALGHALVDPVRDDRVAHWAGLARRAGVEPALVTCWRGGLRSQIASAWLKEASVPVARVSGGYKAMRQELLQTLEHPPRLKLLAGLTGSGKTRLLAALPIREKVDLEELACHRGSSFGAFMNQSQPSQASFENAVAMGLRGCAKPVLIEDESVVIGSLHVPAALRRLMQVEPVIYVDAPLTERVRNIFTEYVARPLQEGMTADALQAKLAASIHKLSRRLGGALTGETIQEVKAAFAAHPGDEEPHHRWIATLLTNYYDKGYTYAFERGRRDIAFRGTYEECQQWILHQYA